MRKIVLDTETTGLDPIKDRIIEIGCVELINDLPSGNNFHRYFNAENAKISEQSQNIHGLSNNFLKQFSPIEDEIDDILDFISDSQIIIHNVSFDLSMINSLLKRLHLNTISENQCFCTLEFARKKFPGSKVNLNALCRKFGINLESREKHGALIDSFLLAQVYIELIGGKQRQFSFNEEKNKHKVRTSNILSRNNFKASGFLPEIVIDSRELKEHNTLLKKIKNPIWNIEKD